MYCAACDIEIKGDSREVCPMCGSPLAGCPESGSASDGSAPQARSAIQGIIQDINSLIDTAGHQPASDMDQDQVFMLRDCAAQETTEQQGTQPLPLFEDVVFDLARPESQTDHVSPEQPQFMDAGVEPDVPLQEMLDSIRQSIASAQDIGTPDAAAADEGEHSFLAAGYDDAPGPDVIVLENRIEDAGDFMPAFDNDIIEMTAAEPDVQPGRSKKRGAVLAAVVIVAVLAVAGYRAAALFTGDAGRQEQVRTVRTVTPIAALQADTRQGLSEAVPETRSGSVADQALQHSAQPRDAQQPETAPSVAFVQSAAPQARTAIVASTEAASQAAPAVAAPAPESDAAAMLPERSAPAVSVRPPFFTVQAGSYSRREAAESEASRIRGMGYDTFVERADLGQRGTWYRVKVGRFKTRAEAESLKAKINKALVPETQVVVHR